MHRKILPRQHGWLALDPPHDGGRLVVIGVCSVHGVVAQLAIEARPVSPKPATSLTGRQGRKRKTVVTIPGKRPAIKLHLSAPGPLQHTQVPPQSGGRTHHLIPTITVQRRRITAAPGQAAVTRIFPPTELIRPAPKATNPRLKRIPTKVIPAPLKPDQHIKVTVIARKIRTTRVPRAPDNVDKILEHRQMTPGRGGRGSDAPPSQTAIATRRATHSLQRAVGALNVRGAAPDGRKMKIHNNIQMTTTGGSVKGHRIPTITELAQPADTIKRTNTGGDSDHLPRTPIGCIPLRAITPLKQGTQPTMLQSVIRTVDGRARTTKRPRRARQTKRPTNTRGIKQYRRVTRADTNDRFDLRMVQNPHVTWGNTVPDNKHVQNTDAEPRPHRITQRTTRQSKAQGVVLRYKVNNQSKKVPGVKKPERRTSKTRVHGKIVHNARMRAGVLAPLALSVAHHIVRDTPFVTNRNRAGKKSIWLQTHSMVPHLPLKRLHNNLLPIQLHPLAESNDEIPPSPTRVTAIDRKIFGPQATPANVPMHTTSTETRGPHNVFEQEHTQTIDHSCSGNGISRVPMRSRNDIIFRLVTKRIRFLDEGGVRTPSSDADRPATP